MFDPDHPQHKLWLEKKRMAEAQPPPKAPTYQGPIRIKTPEENFTFTFMNSAETRERWGFKHIDGKLVLTDKTKLPKEGDERLGWIRRLYAKFNAERNKP